MELGKYGNTSDKTCKVRFVFTTQDLANGSSMTMVTPPWRIGDKERWIDVHSQSLPSDECEKLLRFLRGGTAVLLAPGMIPDPFIEAPGAVVSVGLMTDGVWIWPLAWVDYVSRHQVSPPADFLKYVRSCDCKPDNVTEDRLLEIAAMLGMSEEEEDAFEVFLRGE